MGSVGGADDPPLGPCFVSRRIRNPICPSIVFPKERERKTRERETIKVKRLDLMLYKASFHCELYCLRAAATRLTGKYWAAPYASSLLARSRARALCGVGAFAPAPAAHVRASR